MIGYIEADTPEEAKDKLAGRDYGSISDIYLQSLNLLDDLDPQEDEEEEYEVFDNA